MTLGQIKEIHYYGGGVQLVSSSLKGKLDRARQHNQRIKGRDNDDDENNDDDFAAELSGGGSLDIGFEEVVLDTTAVVGDDRPLAALSLRYMESLLKLDGEVLPSLLADTYKHLTAFGDSFNRFNKRFAHNQSPSSSVEEGKAEVVKGSIHSMYIDERRQVVSIERKYSLGDDMTEIIDILHWQEHDQRVSRHWSYGFSWSSSSQQPVSATAAAGGGGHSMLFGGDRPNQTTGTNEKRSRGSGRYDEGFHKRNKSSSEPRVAFL
jgi:hypothetical protein